MSPKKPLLIASALIVVTLIVGSFILLAPAPAPPPLPDPNGYDRLIEIARQLPEVPDPDARPPANVDSIQLAERYGLSDTPDSTPREPAGIDEFVTNHVAQLDDIRKALELECRVPIAYSMEFTSGHMPDLAAFKKLARALTVEGRWHLQEGRTNEAAQCYLDTVQLGTEGLRGGVLITELVALSGRAMGVTHLEQIARQLDAETCRTALERLQAFRVSIPTVNETLEREREWSRRTFGFTGRIVSAFPASRSAMNKALQSFTAKHKQHIQSLDALLVVLAERAFELDHGRPPEDPDQLVPDYLDELPRDPGTEELLPPKVSGE
jgi:hypothetical protein